MYIHTVYEQFVFANYSYISNSIVYLFNDRKCADDDNDQNERSIMIMCRRRPPNMTKSFH